jgi:tetratricopeptide (TPR) repeat protein
MSQILINQKKFKKSLKILNSLNKINPNNIVISFNISYCYYNLKNTEKYLDSFKEILKIDNKYFYKIDYKKNLKGIALYFFFNKNFGDAIEVYFKISEIYKMIQMFIMI